MVRHREALARQTLAALSRYPYFSQADFVEKWFNPALTIQRVVNSLADTPALKSYLVEAVEKAYRDARKLAIKEGKLAKFELQPPEEHEYPESCPFASKRVV